MFVMLFCMVSSFSFSKPRVLAVDAKFLCLCSWENCSPVQLQSEKRADSGSGSVSLSRSGSAHRSGSGTPNSLEAPPTDLREERRMASSSEEMVELRKHDKAVLERARSRKWVRLPWYLMQCSTKLKGPQCSDCQIDR